MSPIAPVIPAIPAPDTAPPSEVDVPIAPGPPVEEPSIADHEAALTETPPTSRRRHRALSQQATAADVPRIQQLTKRLRETEAERDRLQATLAPAIASPPPVSGSESRAAAEPPATATPAPSPLPVGPIAAKPTPETFETYEAYLDARDAWNRHMWHAEQQIRQEDQRITASWRGRVEEAIKVHQDFEAVALQAETKIPAGSIMDAFILSSTAGAEVLYALQRDSALREELAALPPIAQVEALTLLGQRLTTERPLAGTTGSAAAPRSPAVPRPPNPVRTGPMRPGDEPPGDDASLADHEAFFGRPRSRHR